MRRRGRAVNYGEEKDMQHNVRSAPMSSAPARQRSVMLPLAAVIVGLFLWPVGARFSIDGLLWLVNALIASFHAPFVIPIPPAWTVYLFLAPLPLICSRVEWSLSFRKQLDAHVYVVWILIAGYDAVTTYFGVRYPAADAWAVTKQVGTSIALSGILTAALTFGPEWLIREGWRALRR